VQTSQRANQPSTRGKSARGRTSQEANKPRGESGRHRGEQARGRTSQGANKPGGIRARGESAKGRTSQGANEPRGERAKGRTSQGANRQRGEKAIIQFRLSESLSQKVKSPPSGLVYHAYVSADKKIAPRHAVFRPYGRMIAVSWQRIWLSFNFFVLIVFLSVFIKDYQH